MPLQWMTESPDSPASSPGTVRFSMRTLVTFCGEATGSGMQLDARLRGQRVILDRELAALYDVTTSRLNEREEKVSGTVSYDPQLPRGAETRNGP